MRLAVVVVAAALTTSCSMVRVETRKLPSYAAAMALPSRTAEPTFFYSHSIDRSNFDLVPYAEVIASGGDELARFRKIKKQAEVESADIVLFEQRESQYAGSVGVYWGFGVSSAQPVYRGVSAGVFYRFPAASAGITTDENRMVLSLSDAARQCGIQEGDTLLSADGLAWSDASLWRLSLERNPGDEIQVVWIRPGTGRMEGRIGLCEPDGDTPASDSGIAAKFHAESSSRRLRGAF